MNYQMHPDALYELNHLYQKERLVGNGRIRPCPFPQHPASAISRKDKLFLASGELFIAVGKNLKSRAAQPVCKPKTA
jgi:hypothetical protein